MQIVPIKLQDRIPLKSIYTDIANKFEQSDALFYNVIDMNIKVGFIAAFDINISAKSAKLYAVSDNKMTSQFIEAMIRFMSLCFDQKGFHRLWSEYAETDEYEKTFWDALRFTEDGTARDTIFLEKHYVNSMRRSILAHEYIRFFGNPNNVKKVIAEFDKTGL